MATAYHMENLPALQAGRQRNTTLEQLCRAALDTKTGPSAVALWQRVNNRVFALRARSEK